MNFLPDKKTPLTHRQRRTDMMEILDENTIRELPEKQKMVFQLRDVEGMSYQEISEALDMPMSQVKSEFIPGKKSPCERE